ncbi:OLC1v1032649C1 [Oldenlandia corymbosa var. corymbosa]|uniref:OLC1v1032649C1 n=1 Tax=Oldenlandia corymbosa var. corymbosa TaxID=529605 RepID=A0AAV1CM34_OLDCO|nr:OLC1v1032649C1 [Oldenlandia corymbosa var. corymbosa]
MEDQDSKFVCKWCDKKYPCGKSLGGHMRSHIMALSSAESEQRVEANMKKLLSLEEQRVDNGSQSGGYGLRENPKKTFKAVDATFPMPQEKVCKQCGKGFQSLKALCGHMACHSEKDRGLKDDHSWTSENPKLIMDDSEESDTEAEAEAEEEEDDEEEDEEENRLLRNRSKNNKRYNRIVIKTSSMSFANNSSSSASEIDDFDQEEVAICLMMLSRDSGTWGGVNSVVESSDNNSVVLETKSSSIDMRTGRKDSLQFVHSRDDEVRETKKLESSKLKCSNLDAEVVEPENSDSGYFLDEYIKLESDASVDGRHRNGSAFMDSSSRPKASIGARCEETLAAIRKGFNKTKSYKSELKKQVGRDNGNDSSSFYSKLAEYEARQKSKDSYEDVEMMNDSCRKRRHGSSDVQQSKNTNKRSKYECLNCKKTFNSYQALGGHRPCHKRNNTYTESRYETGENSFDGDDSFKDIPSRKLGETLSSRKAIAKKLSYNAEKKLKSKKSKGHECPFCHRIFKNGQALGGHKRSHFLNGGNGGGGGSGVAGGGGGAVVEVNNNPPPVFKAEYPELIDLNLPAPLEDEGDDQFMPW